MIIIINNNENNSRWITNSNYSNNDNNSNNNNNNKIDIWYSLLIDIKWNICQYLSMNFSISKVLIRVVVKFFKTTSPKAVCILFQALIALIVIEIFPYKFIRNESLNNLLVEEAAVL